MQNYLKHVCWLSVLAIGHTAAAQKAEGLRTETNADGITVTEEGQPVLHYQRKTKSEDGKWSRANYIHPLHDLDGNVVTEDFPDDHKHHRGIFWAWHQVRVGDRKLGDAWVCKDFIWDVYALNARHNIDGSVTLTAEVHWKSPDLKDSDGELIPFVAERGLITVHPKQPDHRLLDFKISLKAMQPDVSIGGSEDVKGYGGFSPRIQLSDDHKFVSQLGDVQPQKTAIIAGPWMDIVNPTSGIAILCHPKNPGSPEPWILRSQRSMQNARFPGADPFKLSRETETILRYRLVIHRGTTAEARIAERFSEFANGDSQ